MAGEIEREKESDRKWLKRGKERGRERELGERVREIGRRDRVI